MSKKRDSTTTTLTPSVPKPAWFYDMIGSIAKHDTKLALKAWDAEILDRVHAHVYRKAEKIDVMDPLEGIVAVVPGMTELVLTLRDVPLPQEEPRFMPVKLLLRPETFNVYATDMNPGNGQYRPYLLFQSFMIDHGAPQYSYRVNHSTGRTIRTWDHIGRWEHHEKWYFIQPVTCNIEDKPYRKRMDLW
jgi:hypothetical protein